jgi:hypothetical protein
LPRRSGIRIGSLAQAGDRIRSLADRLPAGASAIGASLLSQQTGLASAKRRGSGELLSQKKA